MFVCFFTHKQKVYRNIVYFWKIGCWWNFTFFILLQLKAKKVAQLTILPFWLLFMIITRSRILGIMLDNSKTWRFANKMASNMPIIPSGVDLNLINQLKLRTGCTASHETCIFKPTLLGSVQNFGMDANRAWVKFKSCFSWIVTPIQLKLNFNYHWLTSIQDLAI